MSPARRLVIAVVFLCVVVIGGAIGYMVIADARFIDALYQTVIGVTTAGFGEIIDLDDTGRIWTMVVLLTGVGGATFAVVSAIDFVVEGHLQEMLGRRRMDRQLTRLVGHTIVCGFGQVGRHVVDQLREEAADAVVVDPDPDRLRMAADRNLLYVQGDATREEALLYAGLDRAQTVVACAHDDADNVLISLTARGLNPSVFIIARVKNDENEAKAKRAGANRVIAPAAIGGRRIAALIARPAVVDFLDIVTHGTGLDLVLEEVVVGQDSALAGHTLRQLQVRERYGATVLAIRGAGDGDTNTRPSPDTRLQAGDTVVVIGGRDDLERLQLDGR